MGTLWALRQRGSGAVLEGVDTASYARSEVVIEALGSGRSWGGLAYYEGQFRAAYRGNPVQSGIVEVQPPANYYVPRGIASTTIGYESIAYDGAGTLWGLGYNRDYYGLYAINAATGAVSRHATSGWDMAGSPGPDGFTYWGTDSSGREVFYALYTGDPAGRRPRGRYLCRIVVPKSGGATFTVIGRVRKAENGLVKRPDSSDLYSIDGDSGDLISVAIGQCGRDRG